MFGFKKKSKDEVLSAALLKGITEAKTEQAQKKSNLQKTYNKASGMLKGLAALRDLPGSKFEFKVLEQQESLKIETNIPAFKNAALVDPGFDKVTIAVGPKGRIRVYGDTYSQSMAWGMRYYSAQQISSRRRKATEKALTFVSKKAQEKGLLP
jgi:hypothetical protein